MIWQRNCLSPRTISKVIIYKAAVVRNSKLLPNARVTGADYLPIEERIAIIPHEWMQNWWLERLDKIETLAETLEMFGTVKDEADCEYE